MEDLGSVVRHVKEGVVGKGDVSKSGCNILQVRAWREVSSDKLVV